MNIFAGSMFSPPFLFTTTTTTNVLMYYCTTVLMHYCTNVGATQRLVGVSTLSSTAQEAFKKTVANTLNGILLVHYLLSTSSVLAQYLLITNSLLVHYLLITSSVLAQY